MQSKGAAQEEAWPAKSCSEAHLAGQTQSAGSCDGRGSCQLALLYPWDSGVAGSLDASVSPQELSVGGGVLSLLLAERSCPQAPP